MAGLQEKSLIMRLECPVCFDTLKDPRILPCVNGGHTACTRCLEGLAHGSIITCPVCKINHTLPQDGVNGFTSNLIITEIIDTLCAECRKSESNTHCTHCNKDVCLTCKMSHMLLESTNLPKDSHSTVMEAGQAGDLVNNQQANILCSQIDDATDIILRQLAERRKGLKEEVKMIFAEKSDTPAAKLSKGILEYDITAAVSAIAAFGSIRVTEAATERCQESHKGSTTTHHDTELKTGKPLVLGQKGEFGSPRDIAVCPMTGHVIVADPDNSRVHVLSATWQHIRDIRDCGTGQKLKSPWRVAVNSRGDIIVADYYADAVHAYSQSGSYICGLQGPWNRPLGVTVDRDDSIYVCDAGTYNVKVLDKNGKQMRTFGGRITGPGAFKSRPWYITLYEGQVYVSDDEGRIHQFSMSGTFIRQLNPDVVGLATGLSVRLGQDLIVVGFSGPITVVRGDSVVCHLGESGNQPSQLNDPRGVAVTKSGQIIVSNFGNHNILVYDST